MGFKNKEGIVPRNITRRQRYNFKTNTAKTFPISLATINFIYTGNLGYLIRTSACFGCRNLYVVGSLPPRNELMPSSGSLVDYANIIQFSTTHDFLEHVKQNNIKLVAAELCEGAQSLYDYRFELDVETIIITGNEEVGVPGDILNNADKVFIEMNGPGFCLNTAQTANIMIAEYMRQRNVYGI